MAKEEAKEVVKKEKFKSHHLVDWALLVATLVLIIAGAGYYFLTVVDDTSSRLSETYIEDVVVPGRPQAINFSATKEQDIAEIDQQMNKVNPDDFEQAGLNDSSIGL